MPANLVERHTATGTRRASWPSEAGGSRAWLKRDLSTLELAVIMIDGVHVEDHVLLVALGIDTAGIKHVLGVREGATENATACTALLTDIVERGVATDKAILAVLDGAKALARAVRNVWGNRALIQRCQVHKLRNVLDHLPEASRAAAKKTIQKAYRSSNVKEAKSLLQALHRKLADDHPGAAGSLDEGLDETLTVKRFGLPEWLERTLSTTNAIENVMGSFRRLSKNVHRWKNAKMIERWMVTAVIDAGARFRKIRGYVGMKSSSPRYMLMQLPSTPTLTRLEKPHSEDEPPLGVQQTSGRRRGP